MIDLIGSALRYRSWGFSVIPVEVSKKSVLRWKIYQKRHMTDREIHHYFRHPLAAGIAVICGAVSGNLEVIDIDAKNDLSGKLIISFGTQIRNRHPEIFNKLVIASTRNRGYHFLYKCETASRCMVLARRPTTDAERAKDPHVKVKVLIETRADGGYGVVYPTGGYRFLRGSMQSIQILTAEERDALLALARKFNTMPELQPTPVRLRPAHHGKDSPLNDFDARGDLCELLTSYGWTVVKETAERTYYRRPGETDHDTSGDYHHGLGLFSVFTTSTEFIPKKGYRPSAVFAVLECNQDFTLAAKRLIAAGFGRPYWPRKKIIA